MNQFNLGNFLNRFVNYSFQNMNKSGVPTNAPSPDMQLPPTPNNLPPNFAHGAAPNFSLMGNFNSVLLNNLKMNDLSSFERTLYMKDLMNLPKEMEEILVILQDKTSSTEQLVKLLNKNVDISTIAELIQQNGKEAMNKLVLVMANASKQGVNDLSQLKDTIKLINASVAAASKDNPNQTLKSFMLLYLPWLPLQEGVDFELEIENSNEEENNSETSITILISTRNFGNVKVILILNGINSIDVFINCSQNFPKEELLKRINSETKKHSLQSSVTFEEKESKQEDNSLRQAKVSMSNLTEVNPFLLLMANAVIRHTIDLDNLAG